MTISCQFYTDGIIILFLNYNYLSNIFSEVKGITIQQYIIINKIEKVKELLLYDELNLTEISYKLNYKNIVRFFKFFHLNTNKGGPISRFKIFFYSYSCGKIIL